MDRDLRNALRALSPGGVVVLHDALPPDEWHQRPYERSTHPLAEQEGLDIFGEMNPVKYTLQDRPEGQLMGFVVEQSPPAIVVEQ